MKMPRKSDLASVRINRNKPKSLEWRKRQATMRPPIDAALAVRTTGSNQGSSRWGETATVEIKSRDEGETKK
ncbi:hypothetical protein RHGRI_023495 [Rhododendron griersonianum]|uniref:Ribosomal protein S12 n=1 Tax=Rhododendron griersonianum TaxID=479676 RepID=A0AAV6J5T5_9ERIC|nr:hypothetical protein RHGRI_023495 [Rhododendron griersonianum]